MPSSQSRKAVAARRVWRITATAPLGEYVDVSDAIVPTTVEPSVPAKPNEGSWLASSFDLLSGLEVDDLTDSVPGELFDDLFNKRDDEKPTD